MQGLSWNLRIVLGLVALAIIAVIGFAIYYTVIRIDRDRPIDVEVYPNAQLVREEQISSGRDHFYYLSEDDPTEIEAFYRDQGFDCTPLYGEVFVDGRRETGAYIRSTCLLDRSHSLGFRQSALITIQPERDPYQYFEDNPLNQIIGGGQLTGQVVIDVQREWANDGLIGALG